MVSPRPSAGTPFSERAFYLEEFRGRTLAIACPAAHLSRAPKRGALREVTDVLVRNETRVVLFSTRAAAARAAIGGASVTLSHERAAGVGPALIWRGLRRFGKVSVGMTGSAGFAAGVRELAVRLRVFKLVWIDPSGGLRSTRGETLAFVHRGELRRLLRSRPPRAALLQQIDQLLTQGVATVNVCSLDDLREELLTYQGAGTLFTRDRYVDVRPLGVDDFDAAHDLIARGVREGYLLRRPRDEIDRLLSSGFGAFIEGRDLAGVGTLVDYGERQGGEIAALYTLTRFLGEGVGAELVRHALEEARAARMPRVFACTTSERVGRFFARQGFRAVATEALPRRKTSGYNPRRLAALRCFFRRP